MCILLAFCFPLLPTALIIWGICLKSQFYKIFGRKSNDLIKNVQFKENTNERVETLICPI